MLLVLISYKDDNLCCELSKQHFDTLMSPDSISSEKSTTANL